ncbi:hypothetical protein RFI_13108 [Reticulomyxa filosa]|uniref:Uncharacterized protein n=1 Tax=Reticulomyxa filosa TaxID=46433 RepID=X6NFD4_RETFI|nr:hypothetical protein RFI_13108 [Reticulomyxa filosa]|eukprot:ETO24052.1 hypothetical protein RFI_13108 [Reticulomyxa filosa]
MWGKNVTTLHLGNLNRVVAYQMNSAEGGSNGGNEGNAGSVAGHYNTYSLPFPVSTYQNPSNVTNGNNHVPTMIGRAHGKPTNDQLIVILNNPSNPNANASSYTLNSGSTVPFVAVATSAGNGGAGSNAGNTMMTTSTNTNMNMNMNGSNYSQFSPISVSVLPKAQLQKNVLSKEASEKHGNLNLPALNQEKPKDCDAAITATASMSKVNEDMVRIVSKNCINDNSVATIATATTAAAAAAAAATTHGAATLAAVNAKRYDNNDAENSSEKNKNKSHCVLQLPQHAELLISQATILTDKSENEPQRIEEEDDEDDHEHEHDKDPREMEARRSVVQFAATAANDNDNDDDDDDDDGEEEEEEEEGEENDEEEEEEEEAEEEDEDVEEEEEEEEEDNEKEAQIKRQMKEARVHGDKANGNNDNEKQNNFNPKLKYQPQYQYQYPHQHQHQHQHQYQYQQHQKNQKTDHNNEFLRFNDMTKPVGLPGFALLVDNKPVVPIDGPSTKRNEHTEQSDVNYSGELRTHSEIFDEYLRNVGKERFSANFQNDSSYTVVGNTRPPLIEAIWAKEEVFPEEQFRNIFEEEERERRGFELNVRRSTRRGVCEFYKRGKKEVFSLLYEGIFQKKNFSKKLELPSPPYLDSIERNATWNRLKRISYSKLKEICQGKNYYFLKFFCVFLFYF